MGAISLPEEAKLFCGLLISPSCNLHNIHKTLEKNFGPIDSTSEIIPFDFTNYYTKEMGPNLSRQFVSFEKTIAVDKLPEIKTLTNAMEKSWVKEEKRAVNIDPGYLTLAQVVLASTKKFYHRIYLGKGIYAEITLYYRKGWTSFEWSYPDYRSEMALSYFTLLRELLKKQRTSQTNPG